LEAGRPCGPERRAGGVCSSMRSKCVETGAAGSGGTARFPASTLPPAERRVAELEQWCDQTVSDREAAMKCRVAELEAQNVQEPVAWRWKEDGRWEYHERAPLHPAASNIEPLYAYPKPLPMNPKAIERKGAL